MQMRKQMQMQLQLFLRQKSIAYLETLYWMLHEKVLAAGADVDVDADTDADARADADADATPSFGTQDLTRCKRRAAIISHLAEQLQDGGDGAVSDLDARVQQHLHVDLFSGRFIRPCFLMEVTNDHGACFVDLRRFCRRFLAHREPVQLDAVGASLQSPEFKARCPQLWRQTQAEFFARMSAPQPWAELDIRRRKSAVGALAQATRAMEGFDQIQMQPALAMWAEEVRAASRKWCSDLADVRAGNATLRTLAQSMEASQLPPKHWASVLNVFLAAVCELHKMRAPPDVRRGACALLVPS